MYVRMFEQSTFKQATLAKYDDTYYVLFKLKLEQKLYCVRIFTSALVNDDSKLH